MNWRRGVVVACVLIGAVVGGVVGCEEKAPSSEEKTEQKPKNVDPGGPFVHQQSAENLEALFNELKMASDSDNLARAAMLTRALLPDRARLMAVLREDTPEAVIQQNLDDIKSRYPDDEMLGWKFVPTLKAESVFKVSFASSELLWTFRKNTAAHLFPTGITDAAKVIFKPEQTFYIVEAKEPGSQDIGSRFAPFFWDGKQWTYLGEIWRFVELPKKMNLTREECSAMFDKQTAHLAEQETKSDRKMGRLLGRKMATEGVDRCVKSGLPRSVYDCRMAAPDAEEWTACDPPW